MEPNFVIVPLVLLLFYIYIYLCRSKKKWNHIRLLSNARYKVGRMVKEEGKRRKVMGSIPSVNKTNICR